MKHYKPTKRMMPLTRCKWTNQLAAKENEKLAEIGDFYLVFYYSTALSTLYWLPAGAG